MRKNSTPFLMLIILFTLSSCAVNRFTAPPFTDLDKILRLEPGLTVNKVFDILRIDPYDIVHSYETGSMILVYNYRVKDRSLPVPASNSSLIHDREFQRDGEDWFNNNYRELYLLFNNDTLKSVFGERTFLEGSYLEMVDRRLIAAELNDDSINVSSKSDYFLLQNLYQERTSMREEIKLQEDERSKRRREWIKNAYIGIVGIISIVGLLF